MTAPRFVFPRALPSDESSFPAYQVWISAQQFYTLMVQDILVIDPTYQRGKTSATRLRAAVPIQASKASLAHIAGIRLDLATQMPQYGRSPAILPPIWTNCRRTVESVAQCRLFSPPEPGSFGRLAIFSQLFVLDGWHRCLAIKGAIRDGQLDPNRTICLMVLDAPLAVEASAFRILNAKPLPVKETRVAWVSAPFAQDLSRVAYEFATRNQHFTRGTRQNFETVKSGVGQSSALLCSFLAIVNGFTASPAAHLPVWPAAEIDVTRERSRELLVASMDAYWNSLVEQLPALGFCSFEERKASRASTPLLVTNLMVQALLWIGYQYVRAYASPTLGASVTTKLVELRQFTLGPQLHQGLSALTSDCFTARSPLFAGLVNPKTHNFLKNDYGMRRDVFKRLCRHLGIAKANTLRLSTSVLHRTAT